MKMTMRLKTGSSEMVGSVPYYHVSGALSLPSEGKRWSGFGFKELFWFSLKTYKASNNTKQQQMLHFKFQHSYCGTWAPHLINSGSRSHKTDSKMSFWQSCDHQHLLCHPWSTKRNGTLSSNFKWNSSRGSCERQSGTIRIVRRGNIIVGGFSASPPVRKRVRWTKGVRTVRWGLLHLLQLLLVIHQIFAAFLSFCTLCAPPVGFSCVAGHASKPVFAANGRGGGQYENNVLDSGQETHHIDILRSDKGAFPNKETWLAASSQPFYIEGGGQGLQVYEPEGVWHIWAIFFW